MYQSSSSSINSSCYSIAMLSLVSILHHHDILNISLRTLYFCNKWFQADMNIANRLRGDPDGDGQLPQ
jgi:hypothetical protein